MPGRVKNLITHFAEFELFMFHNKIVKISEKNKQAELVENLPLKLPTLQISAYFAFILLWEKVKIFNFLKTIEQNNIFLCIGSSKSLQIYFFCVKRQAKNDFLKDVESTVSPSN